MAFLFSRTEQSVCPIRAFLIVDHGGSLPRSKGSICQFAEMDIRQGTLA